MKVAVQQQPRRSAGGKGLERRVVAPGRAVADAAQTAVGDRDVPFEDTLGLRTQPQVDKADDAGDATRRPVFARGAHRRHAADKLGLAERFELLGPVGAVHLARLLIAGGANVVTAADIGQQLREKIPIAGAVPEMMVGIDDRQVRLDDLFVALVEPVLTDRRLDREHGGGRGSLRQRGPRRHGGGAHEPGAPCQQYAPRYRSFGRWTNAVFGLYRRLLHRGSSRVAFALYRLCRGMQLRISRI
jgi:hypothetical protein